MFWGFFFRLLVGSVLAPFAFAFMLMPFIGIMALTVRRGTSKLSPLAYPAFTVALLAQLYFWGMWAAYCAALAVVRASHPDVTHTWLYYVVAFLFVTAPIGYLASKEQSSVASAQEGRGIQRGSTLYSAFAILAFLAFSFWPALMTTPYGWFIRLTVPIVEQRISPDTLAALRKDFVLSEVITLLQNYPTRTSSRRYLEERQRFNFIATQRQEPMVLDGYSAADLKSPIILYSLFYYGSDGPLTIVDASINPMNVAAKERVTDLLRKVLHSVSNPDGSTLHFLGIYDLDSKRILKIMIRTAHTPLGPDFAIRYAVSHR